MPDPQLRNVAELADVGPLATVPDMIGLCSAHGWWYAVALDGEPCPEPGCKAKVHFYARLKPPAIEHGGRWRNA
jgi:hypothetical protein